MAKNEASSNYTGETGNPLVSKQRRTATGWQTDTQAARGDGVFATQGTRTQATNYGRPMMGPTTRRRRGMR